MEGDFVHVLIKWIDCDERRVRSMINGVVVVLIIIVIDFVFVP